MKHTFSGFYSLNNEEKNREIWNSNETLFIFDTNCLLNLYRCEDATRDDIFSVMNRVSDKIWLPFFVCLEYQKNRRDVITESIDNLNLIRDSLNEITTSVVASLSKGKVKKHLYNSLSDSIHILKDDIRPLIDNFITDHIEPRIESKKEIACKDVIRERIDAIVLGNCGAIPTSEWINSVNQLGIKRFENQIPPGFMDSKKTGRKFYFNLEFEEKYGDLYIWREIIEKSKADTIKNIIFICDDNKKDWWYEKKGITHGALEALQTEIYSEAGVSNFKLLNQATFLHDAQKYISNINIDSKSLKEVQEIYENGEFYTTIDEEYFDEERISSIRYEHDNEYDNLVPIYKTSFSDRYRTTDSEIERFYIETDYVNELLDRMFFRKEKLRSAYKKAKIIFENKSTMFNPILISYHAISEDLSAYIGILSNEIEKAQHNKGELIIKDIKLIDEIEKTLLKCKEITQLLLAVS